MNIALETKTRNRPNLFVGDGSPEGIVNAWSLKPTIEEIVKALHQSFEGWDGNEVVQDAGIIWSIRCHCEAIRLLREMKEEP